MTTRLPAASAPFLSALLVLSSTACTASEGAGATDIEAETAENAVITRVSGSTTGSNYADGSKTYLSVRTIVTLARVGALNGVLHDVALRADGIIANQPADGRVSLKELVRLEEPTIFGTLFPEEKAALPKIWELMETTSSGATALPAVGPLPAVAALDQSQPAGTLTEPTELDIASLPGDLQAIARRVQLSLNADGNASTIALADLTAALASPAP
jgi:hypothetical protein